MLGQFTRQDQSHGRLDFSARHRRLLVISRQFRGFRRDLFEDVVDERIHDAHRFAGNPGVRMDLLQDFVDVNLVGFDLLLGGLLGAAFDGLLRWFLAGHFCFSCVLCVCSSVLSNGDLRGEWSRSLKNLESIQKKENLITHLLKKSRIEWITASRVRNQLARKVSHVIESVVIRQLKAFDTF